MPRIESISIELTRKCNHRCYYCYASDILGSGDIDYDFLKKFINDLKSHNVNCQLQLKGGEPMLSKQKSLELIKNSGYPYEVYTNLNYNLSDNTLEFLKNAQHIMATCHYLNNPETFFNNAEHFKETNNFEINMVVEPRYFNRNFELFQKHKESFNFVFSKVIYPGVNLEMLRKKFTKEFKVIEEYYRTRPSISKTFYESLQTDSRLNPNKKPVVCDQFQFVLDIDCKIRYSCGFRNGEYLDYDEFITGKYFKKVCCTVDCICPSNEESNSY